MYEEHQLKLGSNLSNYNYLDFITFSILGTLKLVLSLLTMADNTCMEELEAAIENINATLKKFMEVEEVRHAEYMESS
jgi:hypothetical protein